MSGGETEGQIQAGLNMAGEDLVFAGGTLKGLPGQKLSVMADFHSPFNIKDHTVSFQVAYSDALRVGLDHKVEFHMDFLGVRYDMQALTPVNDLTGWMRFEAILLGIIEL